MKYKRIYVLAPYKATTGGVELAHQLVDYLRNNHQNAFIVYEKGSGSSISEDTEVTQAYSKYNIEVSTVIEDNMDNILVLPEVYFELIYKYQNIQIACWWMSVNNRYIRTTLWETLKFNKNISDKLRELKRYIQHPDTFRKNDDKFLLKNDSRITHLYQSVYAQYHLYSKGFSIVLPLSDYINTEFIKDLQTPKENVVLYNPKKGMRFTRKIINRMPNCKFVALQGLSRNELVDLMQKAKIYIDFGHFPGKDRLPREAVLSGCCLITGKEGASYFYEDVAIPESYKIEAKRCNIGIITDLIQNIFDDYDKHRKNMLIYLNRIMEEESLFYKEIERVFM